MHLCVPTLNLFCMPFAFCSKIQNHKLCTARKLKGQGLSGVHFESEVQNTFNDIIAKIYPSENFSLNKECIFRQWHSVSLCSHSSGSWGRRRREATLALERTDLLRACSLLSPPWEWVSKAFARHQEPVGPENLVLVRYNIKMWMIWYFGPL